jgi:hypothetical protein
MISEATKLYEDESQTISNFPSLQSLLTRSES